MYFPYLSIYLSLYLSQVKREVDLFLKGGLHSAGLLGDTMLRR